MTADEHPTKISAPQIAAAKRTIINFAPGLAPQSGVAVGGTGCVLAAEMGLFFEIKSSAKCGRNRIFETKTHRWRCSYMRIRSDDEKKYCSALLLCSHSRRRVLRSPIVQVMEPESDRHAAS